MEIDTWKAQIERERREKDEHQRGYTGRGEEPDRLMARFLGLDQPQRIPDHEQHENDRDPELGQGDQRAGSASNVLWVTGIGADDQRDVEVERHADRDGCQYGSL